MKKKTDIIMKLRGDERGFALILSIVIMAAMTAIGIAAITTSNTDMLISRNQKEARTAFYLAEMGLDEAISRMDLKEDNSRFIGETNADKTSRLAGTLTSLSSNNSVSSADLGLGDIGGSYTATIYYAKEDSATWCRDDPSDATDDSDPCVNTEIILYCGDFIGTSSGIPETCENALPVYEIEAVGETSNETTAEINAYVTSSTFNVVPPGGTILFTEGDIKIATGKDVEGQIASYGIGAGTHALYGDCIFDGVEHDGVDDCQDVSGAAINSLWNIGDMDCYIGVCMDEIASFADAPSPYYQSGSSMVTYSPGNGAGSSWGHVCSTDTDASNEDWHICDGNEAKLIYIDNAGAGEAKIAANTTGRGILVVTGDLDLSGGVLWEGMIYVMGELDVTGSATVVGTLMIEGDESAGCSGSCNDPDIYVNGDLRVFGSIPVASSVIDGVGSPRVLRWAKF